MSKVIDIDGRLVGEGQATFIIAEAGANHNGSLEMAKDMVMVAKDIGVDCIKFQTFSAEIFCADKTKTFTYQSQGQEVTESEYEMFKRLEFNKDEWAELIDFCNSNGMPFITTVQDPENLKMLSDLGGLKAIKIGSDDFDHLVNLRLYAETGLPLIISKGMADLGEVDRVIRALRQWTNNFAVLHCVSLYPAKAENLNIRQIKTLQNLYPDVVWGFSDHSQGTLASTLAVGIGAKIIEKHFTLDHELPGPDHWFSMDVDEMKRLVEDIRFAEQALGNGEVTPAEGEKKSKTIMRRRIVASQDLKVGTVLDENVVTFKRAEKGSFISHWDIIKGYRLRTDIRLNQGIDLSDIDFSEV